MVKETRYEGNEKTGKVPRIVPLLVSSQSLRYSACFERCEAWLQLSFEDTFSGAQVKGTQLAGSLEQGSVESHLDQHGTTRSGTRS